MNNVNFREKMKIKITKNFKKSPCNAQNYKKSPTQYSKNPPKNVFPTFSFTT